MHDHLAVVGRTGVLDADVEAEFPQFFSNHPASSLDAGIEFTGPRPLAQTYSDLKAAQVAVVNCNWDGSYETYSRSAVEAQFAGTPVIGAARGSLPEVIAHGRTGLLVKGRSSQALAEPIVALLKNRARRDAFGRAGTAWARPLGDLSLLAGQWEEMVQRAWSGAAAPAPSHPVADVLRRAGYGRGRAWVRDRVRGRAS
jgi:glycosyltransferase involved in cell wall biosynthesis